jgi:NarL family two-component system sensor histidine kinase YdfH
MSGEGGKNMKSHAWTKLNSFARGWRRASALHQLPLILVDVVYIWYLCTRTDDIVHFLCITVLIVIHADLYLLATRTTFAVRSSLPYLLAQTCLWLLISSLSGGMEMVALGLYLALLVKAVELLERAEAGPGAACAYLLLSAGAPALIIVQAMRDHSNLYGVFLVPYICWMAAALFLFLRQAYARQRIQQLLHNLGVGYDELFATHAALASRYAQQSASLVEIEEEARIGERRRVARELHDTVTQDLVGLIMQLDAIDARLAEEDVQRTCDITREAMCQARAALDETRRIISDLRAQECERNSLTQSIQAEIRRFRQATGLLCRCDLRAFTMVPAHAGEHVVLAIKEGLSNIARHAHAHEVWIDLRKSGTRCVLEIRDDGCGFDPSFIAKPG